jgi:hypothetical protein
MTLQATVLLAKGRGDDFTRFAMVFRLAALR